MTLRLTSDLRCVKLPDHNTWVTVPAGAAVRIRTETGQYVQFRRSGAVTYSALSATFYRAVGPPAEACP